MDPGDLSDIVGSREGRGKDLLSRQEYVALVANDLRFLNVLQAMVGDVHQIPTDKDKCCVLMAIRPCSVQINRFNRSNPRFDFHTVHSLWYYFPHRAHEGVIDEIAAAVEKTIETIAKAEAAAALEAL